MNHSFKRPVSVWTSNSCSGVIVVAYIVAEEGNPESWPIRMCSNGRFFVKEAPQARRRLSGMAAFGCGV
jgi:hypothetical protein